MTKQSNLARSHHSTSDALAQNERAPRIEPKLAAPHPKALHDSSLAELPRASEEEGMVLIRETKLLPLLTMQTLAVRLGAAASAWETLEYRVALLKRRLSVSDLSTSWELEQLQADRDSAWSAFIEALDGFRHEYPHHA